MGQEIAEELERIKKEIYQKKKEITNIKELVKDEIDRDFPINLWELSPRELDSQMGTRLSFLNDDIDTRPDEAAITSHRRILGKLIVPVKKIFMRITRFYANTLLEKQRHFNAQLVAFHLASFIRFQHNEAQLKKIEEKIAAVEDNQELLLDELRNIRAKLGDQG